MKSIYCHPDNLEILKDRINTINKDLNSFAPMTPLGIFGLPIFTDSSLPKERPTGKIIYRQDPFVNWEEFDLEWVLYLGFAYEEMELAYYTIDDMPFRVFIDPASYMPKHPPVCLWSI